MQNTRRAHTKSRAGCLTCKRRRVRCDSKKPICSNCLRLQKTCLYAQTSEPESRDSASPLPLDADDDDAPVVVLGRLGFDTPIEGGTPISTFRLMYPPSPDPDVATRDRRLLAYVHRITDDMYFARVEGFVWGTTMMNLFNRIAVQVDHVRQAVCCFACTHLSLLAGSTTMSLMADRYRQQSIEGLRRALASSIDIDGDSILASSYILSVLGPERNEFAVTAKGLDATIVHMQELGHYSEVQALFSRRLSFSNGMRVNSPLPPPSPSELEDACSALQDFIRLSRHDPELVRGGRELYNFLVNIQATRPGLTDDEQFKALYPVRWATTWYPRMLLDLPLRRPLPLAFTALNNMVILVAEPFLPAVRYAFGVRRRAELIISLHQETHYRQEWSDKDGDMFDSLLQTPIAIAKAFLRRKSGHASRVE